MSSSGRRTYDSFGNHQDAPAHGGNVYLTSSGRGNEGNTGGVQRSVSWRQADGTNDDDLVDIESYSTTNESSNRTNNSSSSDSKEFMSPWFMAAFLFISFGYMLPWTALGSLISYFKYTYSARFYVMIYCAYYLPGLPVSIVQYMCNEKVDRWYGSQNAFFTRGVIGYCALVTVLFTLLWVDGEVGLVLLFGVLGMASWWLHGTASMLASLFPKKAIAYLQIGFRCPELYAVVAVYFLDLGKDATDDHLAIFYKLTAIVVLVCGFGVWVLVTSSGTAVHYFQEKDYRIRTGLSQVNLEQQNVEDTTHDGDAESSPLLGGRAGYETIEERSLPPHLSYPDHDSEALDEWTVVRPPSSSSLLLSSSATNGGSSSPVVRANILEATARPKNVTASSSSPNHTPQTPNLCAKFMMFLAHYTCVLPAKGLGSLIQRMFYFMYKDDPIFTAVCPLCVALMVTMWSSIFQASFFAYVNSKRGWNIEQILYFTRLFSDLMGRPLTFLPRPSFIRVSVSCPLLLLLCLSRPPSDSIYLRLDTGSIATSGDDSRFLVGHFLLVHVCALVSTVRTPPLLYPTHTLRRNLINAFVVLLCTGAIGSSSPLLPCTRCPRGTLPCFVTNTLPPNI